MVYTTGSIVIRHAADLTTVNFGIHKVVNECFVSHNLAKYDGRINVGGYSTIKRITYCNDYFSKNIYGIELQVQIDNSINFFLFK